MVKVRVGILLIIVSWLPIAQVILIVAHNANHLTTEKASTELRLTVWGVQIVIGLIGLWLAGSVAVATAKAEGWRRMPGKVWHLFWHGE